MAKAQEIGLEERFTFHDLKAKGVSDFDGDKKKELYILSVSGEGMFGKAENRITVFKQKSR